MAWHIGEATGATKRSDVEKFGRSAALKALELDPNLSEAHLALAGVKWFEDWDWAGAEQSFKRAFDLNPGSMETCSCYIAFLADIGRFEDAIAIAKASLARDPLSDPVEGTYGRGLYHARKYEEAVVHLRRVNELNPQSVFFKPFLAQVYIQLRKPNEALNTVAGSEFDSSPARALAYAALGRRADALSIVSASTKNATDPYGILLVHFALGNKELGFEWLTRAFDLRQLDVKPAKFDPALDGVRSDPRLQTLLARLKIPE